MNVFYWLIGHFSNRGKALSFYKRGWARAQKHDHHGAIDHFTTAISLPDTPTDLRATALYERGLTHVAAGDDLKGVDDLNAILAMEEALVNVKTMARQQLVRMGSPYAQSKV